MSHRNRSQRKGNQLDFFRNDPFQSMHQMMSKNFGFGLHDDFFGRGGDPFGDMMQFSNHHKNLQRGGKEGSYVCQTFVSSSVMGPDGKMKQQSYFQNSAGQNKGGHTISQKQQAYKNSDGIKRIAEERMLNDKGRKVVREKRGNEQEETNHYYNIDDHEADQFDHQWRNINQQTKFLQNYHKNVQSIQNGRRREEPRQLPYRQEHRQLPYKQEKHMKGSRKY